MKTQSQSGFSAVELLITLFIAFLFVMMGYQLYSVAIQGGGESRAKAKASNEAYVYLRAYGNLAFIPPYEAAYNVPCTAPFKLYDNYLYAAPNTRLTFTACYPVNAPQLRLVTSTVSTGNPAQEVTHAIYVSQ